LDGDLRAVQRLDLARVRQRPEEPDVRGQAERGGQRFERAAVRAVTHDVQPRVLHLAPYDRQGADGVLGSLIPPEPAEEHDDGLLPCRGGRSHGVVLPRQTAAHHADPGPVDPPPREVIPGALRNREERSAPVDEGHGRLLGPHRERHGERRLLEHGGSEQMGHHGEHGSACIERRKERDLVDVLEDEVKPLLSKSPTIK
jgi:hypothetical protein